MADDADHFVLAPDGDVEERVDIIRDQIRLVKCAGAGVFAGVVGGQGALGADGLKVGGEVFGADLCAVGVLLGVDIVGVDAGDGGLFEVKEPDADGIDLEGHGGVLGDLLAGDAKVALKFAALAHQLQIHLDVSAQHLGALGAVLVFGVEGLGLRSVGGLMGEFLGQAREGFIEAAECVGVVGDDLRLGGWQIG